jgi:hypothetical protein
VTIKKQNPHDGGFAAKNTEPRGAPQVRRSARICHLSGDFARDPALAERKALPSASLARAPRSALA